MGRFITTLVVAAALAVAADAADPGEFLVRNYDLYSNGTSDLNGRLFVPDAYDPARRYPLVVFYHGLGEVGTNNTSQVNGNIDHLLANAKSREFFLYAPQTPSNWSPAVVERSMRVAAGVLEDYSIDPGRIYLTGLSLGGGAARVGVSRYHQAVAATVPIAAVGGNTTPGHLVAEPIWLHHGESDGVVSPDVSRGLVNAIRAADGGKPPVSFPLNADPGNPYYNNGAPYYSDTSTYYQENHLRYTEFNQAGHGIWGRVYQHDAVYDWMLAQRDPIPGLGEGQTVGFDFGGIARVEVDRHGDVWNPTLTGEERTLAYAVPFAKNSRGDRTSVSLAVVAAFRQEITSGVMSDDGTGPDGHISIDGWLAGTADAADSEPLPGIVRIDGLAPGTVYAIELFGSHKDDDQGRGRITRYTVNGVSQDLDVVGNLLDTALFSEVTADANGQITIAVGTPAGGSSRYGVLSSLRVTAVPEPTSGCFVAVAASVVALGRRRARGPE